MTDVILFSEDALIESAARKIISLANPALNISNAMGRRGFHHLRSRVSEIRRSSSALKFLIFLDGDELGNMCPGEAITEWFESPQPSNIHVRFAFHEVESWLLADRQNMAQFLSVRVHDIPIVNDQTKHAKEVLVRISRRSRRREIVQDMVPQEGFSSIVGPAYNLRLSEFIETAWDINAAAFGNDSLARACKRIAEIE